MSILLIIVYSQAIEHRVLNLRCFAEGPEDFGSRKNQREATSESSDEPQKKKVKIEGIDPALNNNAVFVDATNQQVSRAAEVQVAPINKPRSKLQTIQLIQF